MATFGLTSIVGTSSETIYGGYIYSCPFTLSEDGTATDIYFYGYSAVGEPGNRIYLGIYDNASPYALKATTGPIVIGDGVGNVGWVHGAVDVALAAGTYNIGVCHNSTFNYYCYTVTGARLSYEACSDYSSWPATVAAWDGGADDKKFCAYVIYTTAATNVALTGVCG